MSEFEDNTYMIDNNDNEKHKDELDRCVDEFVKIMRECNNNFKNNETNDFNINLLRNLISEPTKAIHIMINFADIDEHLHDVSSVVKIDVYWNLFNKNIYNHIYNSVTDNKEPDYIIKNDSFAKYYFNAAILVELVKYRLVENSYNKINEKKNEIENDNEIDPTILLSFLSVMGDKIEECKRIIQTLYNWIKLYFQDNEIQDVDGLLRINNITFVNV